jgi:hypothetical protein
MARCWLSRREERIFPERRALETADASARAIFVVALAMEFA